MTSNFNSNAKGALRDMQLLCKRRGTPIVLQFTEYPDGAPQKDAVTGALLLSSSGSGDSAVERELATRAFTHQVSPAMTTARLFAEIQTGDCIMDFVAPLKRVVDAGDTNFADGQVVDLYTLNAANRALADGQFPAVPDTTDVLINDLVNVNVFMFQNAADRDARRNGTQWVQQKIGGELAKSWGVIWSDVCFGQAILLRKAT